MDTANGCMYHVTYGDSKRLIEVHQSSELHKSICDAFQIGEKEKMTIQVWNQDWVDWIDTTFETLGTRGKLKVTVVVDSQADANHPPPKSEDNEDEHTSAPVASSPACYSPQSVQLLPWPNTFDVESGIDRDILGTLNCKQFLAENQRSRFLNGIYNHATRFTLYPTSRQYDAMVTALLTKWPHLTSEKHLSLQDAQVLWRQRIRHKFQNSRKRKDQALQVVVDRKLKKRPSETQEPDVAMFGVKHYLPNRPTGEDQESTSRHCKWLTSEKTSTNPNMQKVDLLMSKTLYDRRHKLVNDKIAINELLDQYPWLKMEGQVLKEFTRITETELSGQVCQMLDAYGNILLTLVREENHDGLIKTILNDLSEVSEDDEKYVAASLAILAVPCMLKENTASMVGSKLVSAKEAPVQILMGKFTKFERVQSFKIYVDGCEVCEAGDLVSAFAMYLSSFYVFNIAHPQQLVRTMHFFDRVILSLPFNQPTGKRERENSRKVSSLIEKLSTHNKTPEKKLKRSKSRKSKKQ